MAEYKVLFPYGDIPQSSRVVIYGAGDIGQDFYHQLIKTKYCDVVGWVDKKWNVAERLTYPLCKVEDLSVLIFDYIVIAIKNESIANQVKAELITSGISDAKIFHSADYVYEINYCNQNTDGFLSAIENQLVGDKKQKEYLQVKKKDLLYNEKKYKIGFLAAGNIAQRMASEINSRITNAELTCVAARDLSRAERFVSQFGFRRAYGDYEEMLKTEKLDLVYISSPAGLHYEHIMMALNYNHNVLCEKPFVLNKQQAEEIFVLAQKKNLFVTDGLWTAHLPMLDTIKRLIEQKAIGDVAAICANSFYPSLASPNGRVANYELGGGVLLENGLYLLSFIQEIIGLSSSIHVEGYKHYKGIDIMESITLKYPNNVIVDLLIGITGVSDRKGYIYGSDGYLEIQDANEYRKVLVYNAKGEVTEVYTMDSGYHYCISEALECIKNGRLDSSVRTREKILEMYDVADEIRRQLSVRYTCEQ